MYIYFKDHMLNKDDVRRIENLILLKCDSGMNYEDELDGTQD